MSRLKIKKNNLTWIVTDTCLIVFDKFKATSFCVYNLNTRSGFDKVKKRVIESGEDELNNWVDILSITFENGLIGSHTTIKKEWLDD